MTDRSLFQLLLVTLVLLWLMIATIANAETHEDLVHAVAHIGGEYLITDMSIHLLDRCVSRMPARIIGGILGFSVGMVYSSLEYDRTQNRNHFLRSMSENQLGIGSAILVSFE